MDVSSKKLTVLLLTSVLTVSISTATVSAKPNDTAGHWAEPVIEKWVDAGFITGYSDGTFRPDNPVTRSEFIALVNRAFSFENKTDIYFTDLSPDYWGYEEIQKGAAAGYIEGGTEGTFRPDAFVTRQEAATIMSRIKYFENADSVKFTDNGDIATWAREYVEAVSGAGVLSGFPDGSFRPDISMTRAEAVTALDILSRIDENYQSDNQKYEDYTLDVQLLKDRELTGDLIISDSNSAVVLERVTVAGTLYVPGGTSVYAEDCRIGRLIMERGDSEFEAAGNTSVAETYLKSGGKISGKKYEYVFINGGAYETEIVAEANYVKLDADITLRVGAKAKLGLFEIAENAGNAAIIFENGSWTDNMKIHSRITIDGKGEINTMSACVSGIKSKIHPEYVITENGAERPRYIGGTPIEKGDSLKNLVIDDEFFDGNGKAYNNVSIDETSADVKNIKASGDIVIKNRKTGGIVTLTNITADGNIYVSGGSVILKNCILKKDIISEDIGGKARMYTEGIDCTEVVMDKLTELKGRLIINGNAKVSAYREQDITFDEIEINGGQALLNTDADTVSVGAGGAVVLSDGNRIDSLSVSGDTGIAEVVMNGGLSYIDIIDCGNENVKLVGSGRVGTLKTANIKNIEADGVTIDKIISDFIPVENIILSSSEGKTGELMEIEVFVKPENASDKTVYYEITDDGGTDAEIVDDSRLVSQRAGTVKIKAEVKNGSGEKQPFTKEFLIEIKDETIPVSDIVMENENWFYAGGELELTARVEPDSATNSRVIWSVYGYDDVYIENNNILKCEYVWDKTSVYITASVQNGLTDDEDYTKEFEITIFPKSEWY